MGGALTKLMLSSDQLCAPGLIKIQSFLEAETERKVALTELKDERGKYCWSPMFHADIG